MTTLSDNTKRTRTRIKVPVPRLLRLLGKVIRYASGGISPQEARDIASDLLEIAGEIVESVGDEA